MITKLEATTLLDNWQCHDLDPAEIDAYIRKELARKLADTIINEDLIPIYTNRDMSTGTLTARVQLKIIQE